MTITREMIDAQVAKDREALAAMSPEMQAHLKMVVEQIRKPSGVNFSDPEVL